MTEQMTGTTMVARMAAGRDWWRIDAREIQGWVGSLPPSATQDFVTASEYAGECWDGRSAVELSDWRHETCLVTAEEINTLLCELGERVPLLGIADLVTPDASRVRCCFGPGAHPVLAIDFDFGDLIVPLSIDHHGMWAGARPSMSDIASNMAGLVRKIDAIRPSLLKREERMRRAMEEVADRIGDHAAPVWLRLIPFPHYMKSVALQDAQHALLFATLNDALEWAPIGTEKIWTVKEVRAHYGYYFREHRRRAAALRKLRATGSEGAISEVALALIVERGLDPQAVFNDAKVAANADRRGGVNFERNGMRENLYLREGLLFASIEFKGGHFYKDTLTLWGDYPESLAIGAKGRKLSDFVDHPALIASGVVADQASTRNQAFDIRHKSFSIPIENLTARVAIDEARLAA
jgi:hypothetical protein